MLTAKRSARAAACGSTLVWKPMTVVPRAVSADLTSFSLMLPTLERIILGAILSRESLPNSLVITSKLPAVSALMTKGKRNRSSVAVCCGFFKRDWFLLSVLKATACSFFKNVLNSVPTVGNLSQPAICTGLEKESSSTISPVASRRKRIGATASEAAANKPRRTVPFWMIPIAVMPLEASRRLSIITPEPSASLSAVLPSSSAIKLIISRSSSTPWPVTADSSTTGVSPP